MPCAVQAPQVVGGFEGLRLRGVGVYGSGCSIWGVGCGVKGLGFRV